MNAPFQPVRPDPVEGLRQLKPVRSEPVEGLPQPNYLVDHHANLIIEAGKIRLQLAPQHALELIKFVERTGYQAHANALAKGAAQ